MLITRDVILGAVSNTSEELLSVKEIAGRLGVPINTAKTHFSRSSFPPTKQVERGKKIYSVEILKRYCLWLYLAQTADSPLSYTANDRDVLLDSFEIDELWNAFKQSDSEFVNIIMATKNKHTL